MKEMMKNTLIAAALITFAATASAAYTPTIAVSAYADSTTMNDGNPNNGIDSSLGIVGTPGSEVLTFYVDPTDTWNTSGGDVNYEFNADGKNASGGTGGTYTENGLTANFGSLVGQIGNGAYFLIGSGSSTYDTNGQVGALHLFVFDSDNTNNDGSISATVSAVPEPASIALMLAGLGFVGFKARRKAV